MVWSITYSDKRVCTDRVRWPILFAWSAEQVNCFFPRPSSRLRIWSRETESVVLSRVSLLMLHTQVESGAYSRDSSRFPRRHPFISSTVIGSDPGLPGHPTAYRWRLLPRVRRHRAGSPQGSSSNGCCLFRYNHGPFFAPISFPTPTIGAA